MALFKVVYEVKLPVKAKTAKEAEEIAYAKINTMFPKPEYYSAVVLDKNDNECVLEEAR